MKLPNVNSTSQKKSHMPISGQLDDAWGISKIWESFSRHESNSSQRQYHQLTSIIYQTSKIWQNKIKILFSLMTRLVLATYRHIGLLKKYRLKSWV